MRLIPISEHEFGRLSSLKKSKPVGSDFSDEIQKKKDQHADFVEIIKQKKDENSLTGEFLEEDVRLESGHEIVQIGEGASEPIDEQKFTEGVKLFGSLFSLIEQRITEVAHGCSKDQRSSNVLTENDGLAVERTNGAIAAAPRTDAVVIDLATVRNRVAANTKNQLDDGYPAQNLVTIARSASSDKQQPSGKTITSDAATSDILLQSRKQTEEDQSPINVGIDNEFKLQVTESASQSQSIVVPATRVDQIVRAVVEQTQQLSTAQVSTGMRELYANIAGQTLRMSLHPVELGSVEIMIAKRGKRLEVTVSPELAGTGRLLLEDVAALARSLGSADSGVDHVQVRILFADGKMESHDVGDLLQFATRQETGTHSGGERPARSAHDRPSQHEGSANDGIRNSETSKNSASQRQSGAVYI